MAQFNKQSQDFLNDGRSLFEVVMLGDKDGNVINSFGTASNIPIAAGAVDGYSHVNKFGATGDGTAAAGTVWDGNRNGNDAVYPYPAAGVITVSSSDTANDNGETVEVQGLDDNYNAVTETITVGSGQSTATYSRVFRARMVSDTNSGRITINQGGSLAAEIVAELGQTLMAVYTIPAGKTGYLLTFHGGSDKAGTNASMIYRIFARTFGEAFNIKGQFSVSGGGSVDIEYPVPLKFTEKTDIKIDVSAGNQDQQVSATFDLILVDN